MVTTDIQDRFAALSSAQQRVARLVVDQPDRVAFGTVAEIAATAKTSPQTVLRFAQQVGLSGFAELQERIQAELVTQLRPAAARIRARTSGDLVARATELGVANLRATLDGVDLGAAVRLLADTRRSVVIIASEAWAGMASVLAAQLSSLRPGVSTLDGPPPRVQRVIAGLAAADVLVAIDVQRYEEWIVDACVQAPTVVAITDSSVSPLTEHAEHHLLVQCDGPGPFESLVGLAALVDVLSAAVADRLRKAAADRLDKIEQAWHDSGALRDA